MTLNRSKWRQPLRLTRTGLTLPLDHHDEYQSKTIQKQNQQRRQFLPRFPNTTTQSMEQASLLLANVHVEQLTSIESTRRISGAYMDPFNLKLVEQVGSYIFSEYERCIHPLARRLQVDSAILDHNLYRLVHIVDHFILQYRSCTHSNVLYDHNFQLTSDDNYLRKLRQCELLILLEYFVQIDVDIFFFKTFPMRSIDSSTQIKPLFSNSESITPTYEMKSCQRLFCKLCQSNTEPTSIRFSTSGAHKHRFINGYETILNSSANCQTSNIIYALTCCCGDYDYIGSTRNTLYDALDYHQHHMNRLIIEYLLNGEPFTNICTCNKNHVDRQRTNRMRLYQHFTHCSHVLQSFLKINPKYWCFIPMKISDAQYDDLSFAILLQNDTEETKKIHSIEHYINNIPKPPMGYTFSKRQLYEQREFFMKFNFEDELSLVHNHYYEATIIALLPEPCSTMLRHMIEILLVTQAETKLNSINLCSGDSQLLYGLPYQSTKIWCESLICPSIQHSRTNNTNASSFCS